MNINWNDYRGPSRKGYEHLAGPDTLADDISEHHEILARVLTGNHSLTGRVALILDPDPQMAGTGAMEVWSATNDGLWVWINPDGEVVEAECPIDRG